MSWTYWTPAQLLPGKLETMLAVQQDKLEAQLHEMDAKPVGISSHWHAGRAWVVH
jgi:hypothetical protein